MPLGPLSPELAAAFRQAAATNLVVPPALRPVDETARQIGGYLNSVQIFLAWQETRRQRAQLRAMTRGADPTLLVSYARTWPNIPARIQALLAKSQIPVDSPIARKVAVLSDEIHDRYLSEARQLASTGYLGADRKIYQDLEALPPRDLARVVQVAAQKRAAHDSGLLGSIASIATEAVATALSPAYAAVRAGVGAVSDVNLPSPGTILRAGTRTAGLAAQTPLDLISASIREAAAHPGSTIFNDPGAPQRIANEIPQQTQAGQATQALAEGRRVDIGSGFLPDPASATGQAAAAAARRYSPYLIGGHAFTAGRAIAETIGLSPDSFWFDAASGLVDAAIALKADPVNQTLVQISKAHAAHKIFTATTDIPAEVTNEELLSWARAQAGITHTPGPAVTGYRLEDWLSKDAGATQLIDRLAAEKSFHTIWDVVGHNNVRVALALTDAETPEQVLGYLREFVAEGRLRSIPKLGGRGYAFTRYLDDNYRFVHDVPNKYIDVRNVDRAVQTFSEELANGMIKGPRRDAYLEKFARNLAAHGRPGVLPVVTQASDEYAANMVYKTLGGDDPLLARMLLREPHLTATQLTDLGYSEGKARRVVAAVTDARRMTRRYYEDYEKVRLWMIDAQGNNIDPFDFHIAGEKTVLPTPARYIDFLSSKIPLVDVRGVKQATGMLANIYRWESDLGAFRRAGIGAGIGFATVLGDPDRIDDPEAWVDAAKRAAAGAVLGAAGLKASTRFVDNIMSVVWKPLVLATRPAWTLRVLGEAEAWMAGAQLDSLFRHPISYLKWVIGRPQGVFSGDVLAEHIYAGYGDTYSDALKQGNRIAYDVTADGRRNIVLGEYTKFRRGEPGHLKGWADEITKANRDPFMKRLARDGTESTFEYYWGGKGRPIVDEMLRDPKVAESWVDPAGVGFRHSLDVWQTQIDKLTGGDPELLDAVRTGRFADHPIVMAHEAQRPRFAKTFLDGLESRLGIAPEYTVGPRSLPISSQKTGEWDLATRWLFNGLMTVPASKLVRSPAFKQMFWGHLLETMPVLTPEAQTEILRAAAAGDTWGKIPRLMRDELAAAARRGNGEISLVQADGLAKAFALDNVENLLHNLARKNQVMDTMRLVFPFGEAFKQVATRWARLIYQNPAVLRRVQQGIRAADQTGFFFTDPSTGEPSFGYSFLTPAAQLLGAGPVRFVANPTALNLVGSGYPGFGPVAQLAVSELTPESGIWDWVRKTVLPFGAPGEGATDVVSRGLDAIAPAWARYGLGAVHNPFSDYLYNTTVMQVMRAKYSTKEYGVWKGDKLLSISDHDRQRLIKDSKNAARLFLVLRLVNGLVLPAASTPEFKVRTKTGKMVLVNTLADEFNRLENDPKVGRDGAIQVMLDRYGEQAITYALEPMTTKKVLGLPRDAHGETYAREHPELADAAPHAWGLLIPAPSGKNTRFDPSVFLLQRGKGLISAKDPETFQEQAENLLGQWEYRHDRELADKNVATGFWSREFAREQLRAARLDIAQRYPGFPDPIGRVSSATNRRIVAELARAAALPSMRNNPVAKAIREYGQQIALIDEWARSKGIVDWRTNHKAVNVVARLATYQDELRKRYPSAWQIFDYVYDADISSYSEKVAA